MKKKMILICALSMYLLICSTCISISAEQNIDWWSMLNHDANNSRYSTSAGPATNSVLWSTKIYSNGNSVPVVAYGKVYTYSNNDKLYCLNAETGSKIWDVSITAYVFYSSPAVANGKVYMGVDMWVFCFDAETGKKIWEEWTCMTASPMIAEGKVFVGSQDFNMYCLNAETGNRIWSRNLGDYSYQCTPAVANGKVYTGTEQGKIFCFNTDNGDTIWENKIGMLLWSDPVVVNGKLYIGSRDNKLYCLNADTGSKIWDYATNSNILSSPAVANGKVYIGSCDNKLYCLNADTGSKIWDYQTGDSIYSSPSIADGKIYIGSSNGKLYCLDANNGMEIWNYNTDSMEYSPAIADGKVYMYGYPSGALFGSMYCFGIEDADDPPYSPNIEGPRIGEPARYYDYSFCSLDPNGDNVYYLVDWGDGTYSNWLGPYNSEEEIIVSHKWDKKGIFTIKVKARDGDYEESDWSTITVIIRLAKIINRPILKFLQQYINMFPILQKFLRL